MASDNGLIHWAANGDDLVAQPLRQKQGSTDHDTRQSKRCQGSLTGTTYFGTVLDTLCLIGNNH